MNKKAKNEQNKNASISLLALISEQFGSLFLTIFVILFILNFLNEINIAKQKTFNKNLQFDDSLLYINKFAFKIDFS